MNSLLTIASVYYTHFDYDLTHIIRALNHGGILDTLFVYITFTGSLTFMVLIIAALAIGGARKEAFVVAIVILVVSLLTFGLKYAIARPRPNDLGAPLATVPAFPSAHTANAFALATTISVYHRKFAAVMFSWALLIAFSRVYLGLHYVTDLVGGAALGFAVSYIITRVALRFDKQLSNFVDHPVAFLRQVILRTT